MIIDTTSEDETIKAAQNFAKSVQLGDIILLSGTLGAGKSVFARAFIRFLTNSPDIDVPSPTFTLVQIYDFLQNSAEIWHFDLYRLEDPEEIYEIGWEEVMDGQKIALIEWPERLGDLKPKQTITINIQIHPDDKNARKITIERP